VPTQDYGLLRDALISDIRELKQLRVAADEVCETCKHWTRLQEGQPTGECSEWGCDGRKPLLFEDEFCSRWKAKP
jgi:hypothetical protein